MTAAGLLSILAARGVRTWAAGGSLLWRPASAANPYLRAALATRRAELLELLAADPSAGLPANLRPLYAERAAALEAGGLPRPQAHAAAIAEMINPESSGGGQPR